MLTWHCKDFQRLSVQQLYAILKVRQDVFIIEQNCIYADLDSLDVHCRHLFATIDTKEQAGNETQTPTAPNIVAYARLLPPKLNYREASFGRVLTTASARGTGVGKLLIKKSIESLQKQHPEQPIKIAAQLYLEKFYRSFGFKQISEPYDEDGIEHIDMLL